MPFLAQPKSPGALIYTYIPLSRRAVKQHPSQWGKALGWLCAAPCQADSRGMVPVGRATWPGPAGLGLSLPCSPIAPALRCPAGHRAAKGHLATLATRGWDSQLQLDTASQPRDLPRPGACRGPALPSAILCSPAGRAG